MKPFELRKKSAEELNTLMLDLYREQFNLRMQQGSGQMTKPSRMREVRRDIARIKTLLTEMGKGETA